MTTYSLSIEDLHGSLLVKETSSKTNDKNKNRSKSPIPTFYILTIPFY